MEGLFFYVGMTEGNRQLLDHLNGSGPDGDPVIETPGRLTRLITFFRRAASSRPASQDRTDLRPSGASTVR